MSDDQIEHMVRRFLQWKLPKHFCPDAGISFEPEFNKEWNAKHGNPPQFHEPVGTNLFSYDQAEQMVRHMIEGLPATPSLAAENRVLKDALRGVERWLHGVTYTDLDEIVADGGITAGMVVQQEAREQVRRIDAALHPATQGEE